MSKVNFQPPISGQELKSPDLPTEKKPASDSSAKITHAKSKHGGENILKRSVDLFRRISIGKSRVHVNMELDKKIGTRPNEESSTGHIKTRTQKTVSFSKSGHNNQPAVKSEPSSVRESKVWTRDELNLMSLTNGLIKVAKDKANGIDNNKKNEGLANSSWYKIIYYDLDKSDIRKDMIKEMNEAVEFLLANPELKITIT